VTNVTEVADDINQREYKADMMFEDLHKKLQKAKFRGKDFFDANAESSRTGNDGLNSPTH
jgi:hypothetical protein